MPSPSSNAYNRPDIGPALQEIDVAALEAGFVGLKLSPPFMTRVQSGTFPKVPLAALVEEIETARSAKAGYARSDSEFGDDTFATKEHGAEEVIDDRQAAIYADSISFDQICGGRARYKVLNRLEREVKTIAEAAGAATAVTVPWSVPTADPVADVLGEIDLFKAGCGMLPNAGWLTDKALRKIALNGAIRDQIKYSGMDDPKMLTEPGKRGAFLRALADLFGLPDLVVCGAPRNTAAKGATVTMANIWTDGTFGLIKLPTSQDLEEACAMRTFMWGGDGAGGEEGVFETYRDETIRSEVMRYRHERQVKLLLSVCIRRLTGVVV
jgi:hypothetical protein